MPSLYDRISRRLEDGRDEYYDFGSDIENGRRNMFGLKTQKWHDYEKRHQLQRDKHSHRGEDPRHRTEGNRTHDRAHPNGRNKGHDRAHSAEKVRDHGRSKHVDDKDAGGSLDRPEDRDRRQHASHNGSSRHKDSSMPGAERKKESSKASNNTPPPLGVKDGLIDVAWKVAENLFSGSTWKPEKNRKRHRRRRPRTNRETGGDDDERQHKHRARTPEGTPDEPARQQRGAPPKPAQDHGEAEGYYQGHPLQHQQVSGGRPQGPPSYRQPNNASLQSHSKAPEQNGALPLRSSQRPRSGEDPSYRNNGPSRRDEERQWKTGPRTRETRPRQSKTQPRDLEEEQSGDEEEAQENYRRPRVRRAAAHETPGPSSARDFGRSPNTGKSSHETVTSTSINEDSNRENDTDRSSVGSRRSSLVTQQPAKKRGSRPKNGKAQGGEVHRHEYAEDSEEGHSEAEDLHIRGGGQYDDNEDVDSNAEYSEYEDFDDEYLGDFHILRDDGAYPVYQTRTVPLVNEHEGYSSLSYVAAKMKSGADNYFSYDCAKPKNGGYSPLSYAAAKAKTADKEYTTDFHRGNLTRSFYEHCGRPNKVSPNLSSKETSASERHINHSSGKTSKDGHNKTEYAYTPLRETPEPYGGFSDSESERPKSPEQPKSKNKPRKSNVRSSNYERLRKPEPSSTKLIPRKFNVRFQDRSESPPPRPKYAPKSKGPPL